MNARGFRTTVILFILLSIGFGGFLRGKGFRYCSFATNAVLASVQAPQLMAGRPRPWMGFTERINIYATMPRFALLSITLGRIERKELVSMQQYEHVWQ